MTNEQKKSYEEIMDSLDYVLETYTAPDYIEVIGKMGGDVIRYRIYKDGMVGEK